jgi:hypothetical protein
LTWSPLEAQNFLNIKKFGNFSTNFENLDLQPNFDVHNETEFHKKKFPHRENFAEFA